MTDETKETKFDTGQLRAIVEDAVERSLDKKLQDRPTRAEVENMIATRTSAHIDQLEKRLEKLLEVQIGSMRQYFESVINSYETRHTGLQKDIEDTSERIEVLDVAFRQIGATHTLTAGAVNTLNRAVFGMSEGDGPESLYAMIRRLNESVTGLATHYQARLSALEVAEASRAHLVGMVRGAMQFMRSKEGIGLLVAIGTALAALLGLPRIVQ